MLKVCLQHSRFPRTIQICFSSFLKKLNLFKVTQTVKLFGSATILTTSIFINTCKNDPIDENAVRRAIKVADDLYDSGKHAAIKDYLESQLECECMASAEILWRLSRAYYDVAEKTQGLPSSEKKALIETAFSTISRALPRGEDNFAVHKWYGIILNKISEFQGTKATILNSFVVRDHWMRAEQLNPEDPTTSALLGEWCLSVASVSRASRAAAALLLAQPPAATADQALAHLAAAERKQPGFWARNRLLAARSLLLLRRPDEARVWLESIAQMPQRTDEDRDVAREAAAALARLPPPSPGGPPAGAVLPPPLPPVR